MMLCGILDVVNKIGVSLVASSSTSSAPFGLVNTILDHLWLFAVAGFRIFICLTYAER